MRLIAKILLSLTFFLTPHPALATSDAPVQGRVVSMEGDIVRVELDSGEIITATHTYSLQSISLLPKLDDLVFVAPNISPDPDSTPYIITDFSRTRPLILLTIIFLIITLAITRFWGLKSFLGMIFSFYLIFQMLLPQIMAGQDPVMVTIVTSLFIIPVTFYLSHGINRKTNAAILGTVIALIITGLLATLFVDLSHLSGLASEEAGFLFAFMGETINTRGLLLAGIILGTLGVLDDVTVSQSAIITELKSSSPQLSFRDLYTRAMRVGHDHISSMVNTLVLVYTGASLPLLLLFLDSSQPLSSVINSPIIAEEIVRTLVGSIGLVLAVPLTTVIAAHLVTRRR